MQNRPHRPSVRKRTPTGKSNHQRHGTTRASKRRAQKHDQSAALFDPSKAPRVHASDVLQGASPAKALLNRREFLVGALGLGAMAAIGGGAYALSRSMPASTPELVPQEDVSAASTSVGDLSVLNVPQGSVFTTEQCEFTEDSSGLIRTVATASLPFGTLIWANDDTVAACLLPCETSDPLVEVGLISLESGALRKVLTNAVSAAEGYQIYDVRANASGMVWVEANILKGDWRVYNATLSDSTLGPATLVASGNADWDVPSLAVFGEYSYWQMLPSEQGSQRKADSTLRRATFGQAPAEGEEADVVFTSPGRMACAPATSTSGIVIAPRTETKGTYYQLTHLDGTTGEIIDTLVLPNAMKPSEVAYGTTGFSFAFDSIYDYGDGISNLGTYTPVTAPTYDVHSATQDASSSVLEGKRNPEEGLSEKESAEVSEKATQTVADLYSSAEWFRFPRTPFTTPTWCGNLFLVKSTNVVAGVDLAGRRYFSLGTDNATQDYGEYLASCGTSSRFITYANVDYTPIDGAPINECSVRIWETV